VIEAKVMGECPNCGATWTRMRLEDVDPAILALVEHHYVKCQECEGVFEIAWTQTEEVAN
jgi:predicted  nucleic acid-binding Zn ribbon protein